jgi:hypothetical protein
MRTVFALLLLFSVAPAASAQPQIRVHPTGVNVNAHTATVVFLTYGGLGDYIPVEAVWCGELVDAFPDAGQRCDSATLFGRQPLRAELSARSGAGGLTDIMSIPSSVARRAYQAAASGADSRFFYVRRFTPPPGVSGPDVFVAVTCRLTGGGARTPFALLDVQLRFETNASVLSSAPGDTLPELQAEISYNGTGTLRGRWEVVRPGEPLPTTRDLLTEATLPVEERGLQQRYTEVGRFSLTLPPSVGARFILPGPDPSRLPHAVEGLYYVLLRIEATNDKEGDSDLAAAGTGTGTVHSGAVAGFPLPMLRYYIGGSGMRRVAPAPGILHALHPIDGDTLGLAQPVTFSWTEMPQAALYRLQVESAGGDVPLRAVVPASLNSYRAPPWLTEAPSAAPFRWRIEALDFEGHLVGRTPWYRLFTAPSSTL